MCKAPPAGLQCIRDVSEVDCRVLLQVCGEINSRCVESSVGLRRENQKLGWMRRDRARLNTGRFLQNEMHVRSTNAEGAHSRAARHSVRLPCGQLRIDEEW